MDLDFIKKSLYYRKERKIIDYMNILHDQNKMFNRYHIDDLIRKRIKYNEEIIAFFNNAIDKNQTIENYLKNYE